MSFLARVVRATTKHAGGVISLIAKGCGRSLFLLRPGRGGRIRRESAARLEAFGRGCQESSSRMEQDFLELGQALRQLYMSATQLAGLIGRNADGLREALSQTRISGPEGVAARSIQGLRGELEQTSGLLSNLREVLRLLHRLQSEIRSIERVGVFLKSSVFSFAIESARTPECQMAFGAFVEELRGLTGRVGKVAQQILTQIHSVEGQQVRALGTLSRDLEEARKVAQNLESSARCAAAEAQELLDASCAALQESERQIREVARHADEAVYHMQFGDIIRQKLEHVTSSIQTAATQMKEAPDQDFGNAAAVADRLVAVQIGQLELMRQEVSTAREKLKQAFRNIADETRTLAGSLESWKGGKAGRDPLEVLLKDSSRMQELGSRGHELQTEARETASQAVAASEELERHLEQVRVINSDMHIEALNAIVKTAALGSKGATLEVLSMQVDWLYRESSQAVKGTLGTLDLLLEEARKTTPGQAVAGGMENGGDLAAGLDRVGTAYRSFCQSAAEAAAQVSEQQAALTATEKAFGFLDDLIAGFDAQIGELTVLRQRLAPWINAELSAEAEAAVEGLYTMESERQIHQKAKLGEAPVLAAVPAAAADDGMEFFAPPAPPPARPEIPPAEAGVEAASRNAGADMNMEFFDAPAPVHEEPKAPAESADRNAVAVNESKPPAKPAADDNIEFF
jgi:DNA-binding protein H-NS